MKARGKKKEKKTKLGLLMTDGQTPQPMRRKWRRAIVLASSPVWQSVVVPLTECVIVILPEKLQPVCVVVPQLALDLKHLQ